MKCMRINFMGEASLVSEILLIFCLPLNGQIFPSNHGGQKIELPQKIHASRG